MLIEESYIQSTTIVSSALEVYSDFDQFHLDSDLFFEIANKRPDMYFLSSMSNFETPISFDIAIPSLRDQNVNIIEDLNFKFGTLVESIFS